MNKPIDAKLLRAVAVSLEHHLASFGVNIELRRHTHNSGPFAKREAGKQRRQERQHVRAAKRAWLEG